MMANTIANQIGEGHPRDVIATTLVVYALSSILTGTSLGHFISSARLIVYAGLAFLLLGALKLGAIIGFFPRHILVGYVTW